jgi:predicted DNA binding CopG/RHH family protein
MPKKREHRKKESRCTTRLTKGQARLLRKTLADSGMTMQQLLFNAIDAFMRVAAPEAWAKENARTAATDPSTQE